MQLHQTFKRKWLTLACAWTMALMPTIGVHAAEETLSRLPVELEAAWAKTKLSDATLSVVVQEVNSAQPLMAINEKVVRNPASVMKLVTTYAALQAFGPAWQWKTQILLPKDTVIPADGRLQVPLMIRTSGDPSIQLENLWSTLYQLRNKGVRELNDVVIDRSIFGQVAIDPGAFDGEPMRPYNASPDAWILGLNAVRIELKADVQKKQWKVLIDPPMPYIQIGQLPAWTEGNCPAEARINFDRVSTRTGYTLNFPAAVKSGCDGLAVYRVIATPQEHTQGVLTWMWKELGGSIRGRFIYDQTTPSDAQVILEHRSPPLSQVVRDINKLSNNLMARQLLLTLAAEYHQQAATEEQASQVVMDIFRNLGLNFPELVIENGAGLSRKSAMSAESLGRLLQHAWQSSVMPEFMSSLAIAGTDGTVRKRLKGAGLQGNSHLKTGTLRNVRAVAGYVLASSGKRFSIVVMVNADNVPDIRPFQDALIEWVAKR